MHAIRKGLRIDLSSINSPVNLYESATSVLNVDRKAHLALGVLVTPALYSGRRYMTLCLIRSRLTMAYPGSLMYTSEKIPYVVSFGTNLLIQYN
jgi:hypothetical protein